ncbi:C-type lectin domain family 2 member D-like [Pelodiscus sinensis]|uniref:C-type lectin domain family 2 member D-like n=1 Tax=Pelodiscus sinensis TaxID=13735 RepID=UPI003F6BB0C1
MEAAAGHPESQVWLQEVIAKGLLENREQPEPRGNCNKRSVALGIILGVMFLGLLVTVIALAVSLSGRAPAVQGPACLDSWVGYQGKCFYFSEGEGNWPDSRSRCSALGASLSGIDTLQEMAFLLRYKGTSDYWIGLWRDPGQPWKWANNTEFNNLFVIGGDGDCAYLNEKKVASSRCTGDLPWICSKPDVFTAAKETPAG